MIFPMPVRNSGVDDGKMVGMGVRVGVGGNQMTVGVAVLVGVDVSVGGDGSGVVGRQAASAYVNRKICRSTMALRLRIHAVPICYAVLVMTCARSGPTDMVRTGIPAISSTL
jgi:hypothetical protein